MNTFQADVTQLKGSDMRTKLLVPGRAKSVWLKGREHVVRDEIREKGLGQ